VRSQLLNVRIARYPPDGRRANDTIPITTRQLEALIRLCQARAKACLRDYVLKEDALDVVELMSYSVEQVHMTAGDDEGSRTIDVLRGGAAGCSNRKIRKALINEIHRVIGSAAECSLDDIRQLAMKLNCDLSIFQTLVEDLRTDGVLMRKANGRYQVL
jgi:DNA replicative helicase MCM subunit Mcm2 (Cdc46/Mcm family)